jgi:hypothetical protein
MALGRGQVSKENNTPGKPRLPHGAGEQQYQKEMMLSSPHILSGAAFCAGRELEAL